MIKSSMFQNIQTKPLASPTGFKASAHCADLMSGRLSRPSSKPMIILQPKHQELIEVVELALEKAAQTCPIARFMPMFNALMDNYFRKAEVDDSDGTYLEFLTRMLARYGQSVILTAQLLILEAKNLQRQSPHEALQKLNRAKHLLLDSTGEHLLPKALFRQGEINSAEGDQFKALTSFTKSVQFAERFLVENPNYSQQIRSDIAQGLIASHFQIFRLLRDQKLQSALQNLIKAHKISERHFGHIHRMTGLLGRLQSQATIAIPLTQKEQPQRSLASTVIKSQEIKKNQVITVSYLWEEQKINVEMFRTKGLQRRLISQASTSIRLDMSQLKILKDLCWVQYSDGQVHISQSQLNRLLGLSQQTETTSKTKKILKSYSRDDLIKKGEGETSQDEEFEIGKPDDCVQLRKFTVGFSGR